MFGIMSGFSGFALFSLSLCFYGIGLIEAACKPPPATPHTRIIYRNRDSYTLICNSGFADGRKQVRFTCRNSRWVPDNPALGPNPKCIAQCNPPCQNGGICVPACNVCECPDDFRGKYCQYPATSCDIDTLGITNQIPSCDSDHDSIECTVSCPDGQRFETEPSDVYKCLYAEDTFPNAPPPRCVKQCKNGFVLLKCAPNGQPDCQGIDTLKSDPANCVEDCYCPEGTFLENGSCLPKSQCPCLYNGVSIPVGNSINVECNTCDCKEDQQFSCTEKKCGATCTAWGDPHYINFNGVKFDYQGKCSYYLLIDQTFTIEGENVGWSQGFRDQSDPKYSEYPAVTKSITIRTADYNITLGQGYEVLINGIRVIDLPIDLGELRIGRFSSLLVGVEFPNGVLAQYDGSTTAYIFVPTSYRGKTKGLCGTFGGDDSEVMKDILEYGELWKTDSQCNSDTGDEKHPCDANPNRVAEATRLCAKLTSDIFAACKLAVPPETAYQNCLYDLCASAEDPSLALCPSLANYAKECAAKGVIINWRDGIEECSLQCPRGQVYQVCHNGCRRTCADISRNVDCQNQCSEGCNCPQGQALNAQDQCIPIRDCQCSYEGGTYPRGFRRRDDNDKESICVCEGGLWRCFKVPPPVIEEIPKCEEVSNATIRDFTQILTRTCKNMHKSIRTIPGSSCICKDGEVFNDDGICIPEDECPCYYAGRSYEDEEEVRNRCQNCRCSNGRWICTQQPCLGQCSVWGQGHYETFDSTAFDFQGTCEYIVSAGSQPDREFEITTKYSRTEASVRLETITIKITYKDVDEVIILKRDQRIYPVQKYQFLEIHDSIAYVEVEAARVGLRVQWDRANGLHVKLQNYWRRNTQGLCGDYDGAEDSTTFIPSWLANQDCIDPTPPPKRCSFTAMQAALQKCRVIKSDVFSKCNRVENPEEHLVKCTQDLCHQIDDGIDNDALCGALAAYSQICLDQGIQLSWRCQDLCPLQCGTNEVLVSTQSCPSETCENINNDRTLCIIDSDREACISPTKCPANTVLKSRWSNECIPRTECKGLCLQLKGVTYFEGDVIETFKGKTCLCTNGKKVCS